VIAPGDAPLLAEAAGSVVVAVLLITRLRLHPFVGLLSAAILLAALAGSGPASGLASIEKGFASVLGAVGLVVALGITLGAILDRSGAAAALARRFVEGVREPLQPWAILAGALVIGLPLFFETGVVVLLPVVGAIATAPRRDGYGASERRLRLLLPALAGLSALHALVPPHPGPLAAAHLIGASVGRTLLYGALIAVPVGAIGGPLFARFVAPRIDAPARMWTASVVARPPPVWMAGLVVLLPVGLIANGEWVRAAWPASRAADVAVGIGTPAVALLIATLAGLLILQPFRRRPGGAATEWFRDEVLRQAASILLSIGAGGAFKQVLVDAGLAAALLRMLDASVASPLILGWLIAAAVRLATGSATVATITASGLMAAMPAAGGVQPEWIVLAIGSGSIFFSYVNDPGFWLVKGFLGTSTSATVATWSVLETLMSVSGLLAVLLLSRLIG